MTINERRFGDIPECVPKLSLLVECQVFLDGLVRQQIRIRCTQMRASVYFLDAMQGGPLAVTGRIVGRSCLGGRDQFAILSGNPFDDGTNEHLLGETSPLECLLKDS
jgi:hypothetical protein